MNRIEELLKGQKWEAYLPYFVEISNVARGSGDQSDIIAYLEAFARSHDLPYETDELGNVIMHKAASEGCQHSPEIVLQGHMDMVMVREEGNKADSYTKGVELYVEDDLMAARGSTLGADNGIAVAYMLAILADYEGMHPPITALFTANEEIGLLGAMGISPHRLSSNTIINMDSGEEGVIIAGCAGGISLEGSRQLTWEIPRAGLVCYHVEVYNGKGGHSGTEIHLQRGNAICLLVQGLQALSAEVGIGVVTIVGGNKGNVIPSQASATVLVAKEEIPLFMKRLEHYQQEVLERYRESDPEIRIRATVVETSDEPNCVMASSDFEAIQSLIRLPDGVVQMSGSLEGLVQTSINFGVIACMQGELHVELLARSSVESELEQLKAEVTKTMQEAGFQVVAAGGYPGWEYREKSPLRDLAVSVYEDMYHSKPVVTAVHAGLECGVFSSKVEDMDAISLGPNLWDIHSVKERMSISSADRVWKYLLGILQELGKR